MKPVLRLFVWIVSWFKWFALWEIIWLLLWPNGTHAPLISQTYSQVLRTLGMGAMVALAFLVGRLYEVDHPMFD